MYGPLTSTQYLLSIGRLLAVFQMAAENVFEFTPIIPTFQRNFFINTSHSLLNNRTQSTVRNLMHKNIVNNSYLLQAKNKCFSTLDFVYLSCFTHRFFNNITIVVVILGKKTG